MDLRAWILHWGEQKHPQDIYTPEEVARAAFPPTAKEEKGKERWRRQIRATRAAAIGLAREGRIEILRKGEVVDVHAPIKGLIKLRCLESKDDPTSDKKSSS